MNRIEIFNEICILICSYNLTLFTGFLPDPQKQYDLGFLIISIVCLNITVNTTIMMVKTIQNLRLPIAKIRLWYSQWKKNRQMKQKEDPYYMNAQDLDYKIDALEEKINKNIQHHKFKQGISSNTDQNFTDMSMKTDNFWNLNQDQSKIIDQNKNTEENQVQFKNNSQKMKEIFSFFSKKATKHPSKFNKIEQNFIDVKRTSTTDELINNAFGQSLSLKNNQKFEHRDTQMLQSISEFPKNQLNVSQSIKKLLSQNLDQLNSQEGDDEISASIDSYLSDPQDNNDGVINDISRDNILKINADESQQRRLSLIPTTYQNVLQQIQEENLKDLEI